MKPFIIGALVGATLGYIAWWFFGYFVGLANDYEIYRRYAPHAYVYLAETLAVGALVGILVVRLFKGR